MGNGGLTMARFGGNLRLGLDARGAAWAGPLPETERN